MQEARVVYFRTEGAPPPHGVVEHPFILAGRWPDDEFWPDTAIRVETHDGRSLRLVPERSENVDSRTD